MQSDLSMAAKPGWSCWTVLHSQRWSRRSFPTEANNPDASELFWAENSSYFWKLFFKQQKQTRIPADIIWKLLFLCHHWLAPPRSEIWPTFLSKSRLKSFINQFPRVLKFLITHFCTPQIAFTNYSSLFLCIAWGGNKIREKSRKSQKQKFGTQHCLNCLHWEQLWSSKFTVWFLVCTRTLKLLLKQSQSKTRSSEGLEFSENQTSWHQLAESRHILRGFPCCVTREHHS